MSDEPIMNTAQNPKPIKPANNGPLYALGLYPNLAEIFRKHGYALAIHGSVAADFDLIAVPWTDAAVDPLVVIDAVHERFAARFSDKDPHPKPHGRVAYRLALSYGDFALDISFTPQVPTYGPDYKPEDCPAVEDEGTKGF